MDSEQAPSPGTNPSGNSPDLQRRLFAYAMRRKRAVKTLLQVALAALIMAAVAGAVRPYDFTVTLFSDKVYVLGALIVVFFMVALGVRVYRTLVRPELGWYNAQVLGEEAKSLGWQFAIGGSRYGIVGAND